MQMTQTAPGEVRAPVSRPASGAMVVVAAVERLEHEDLHGEVRIDVVVAHEADDLASRQALDLLADLRLHDALPASAEIEHGARLARVGERLLAVREAVLEDDEHAVVAERGLRLRRAAAGGARERADDGVRDRGGQLTVAQPAFSAH